jgi:nucleoside-diphosphate-sugar epimerase
MSLMITGAAGYVGSKLTRKLAEAGHKITAVDTFWFSDEVYEHPNVTWVKEDIRNVEKIPFDGITNIVHLANIANDPSVELDPVLSWEVNVLGTKRMLDFAERAGVKQFIFASSGSVYGIKEEESVTEDLLPEPISVYNKTKMVTDRIVMSYNSDKMNTVAVRPATVCGLSPRMRFDLSVNVLTISALEKGKITVFGGDQTRPNIHIDDMLAVYEFFLRNSADPKFSGVFNAGFENFSIMEIANLVQKHIPCEVVVKDSNDPRSYRLDSTKLMNLGFKRSKGVENAILELKEAYAKGQVKDSDQCHNVRWMKNIVQAPANLTL